MKYRTLGKGPRVSAIGLGCMSMSEAYGPADEKAGIETIREAFNQGITLFDTADVYGKGQNETLLGKAVQPFRDQVIIATKCGIDESTGEMLVNNDRNYIKQACNDSLKRLGIPTIDLYYLHRHNPEVPIEHSMETMRELLTEGKIRYVGLSEVDAETIERAHNVLGDALVAVQTEYSIINRAPAEAILPTCKKLNIAFVAWSPLARGLLSGKIKDRKRIQENKESDFRNVLPQFQEGAFQHNLRLVEAIEAIAAKKNCTPSQLALAWLLAQDEHIIPIPGTKKVPYLHENIGALDIALSSSEFEAFNRVIQENPVQGIRYPEELMKAFHLKL